MPPLQPSQTLSTQQEAERQAIQSVRGGGALTGKFLSTSSLPAGMSYHSSACIHQEQCNAICVKLQKAV